MKAVIQRVSNASVRVNGELKGSIAYGLLVYLGIARDDNTQDADWIAEKTVNMRIFDDSKGKMNLSLLEILINHQNDKANTMIVNHEVPKSEVIAVSQGVLAVSQFTLLGDACKGRRPSWEKAAAPDKARELYQYFIKKVQEKAPCQSGEFQARMEVSYTNEGPVTILLDSGKAR